MASADDNNSNSGGRWQSIAIRSLRIFAVLTVAAIILVGGTLTYLALNPSALRVTLENLLTSVTDRPFRIAGEFDFQLGEDLYVRAEQVTWANAEWSETPNMLEIEQIDLEIELASLFVPPVVITSGDARNAQLEFEWNEDGVSNWYFFADEAPDLTTDEQDTTRHPLPLLLDKARLTNVNIVFKDPVFTAPVAINIVEAQQQQDADNNLVIESRAQMDDRYFTLNGTIGPFPELIVAGAVTLDATAIGPIQSIRVKASTDKLLTLGGAEFDIDWNAPDAANALQVFNLPGKTEGPIALKATLTTEDGRAKGFIDGDIGEFYVDGKFSAPEISSYDDLHVTFSSSGPSALAAGRLVGIRGLPSTPYKLSLQADSASEGLRISNFYAATAGAELKADALLPQAPTFSDADVNLSLSGNNMERFQGLTKELVFPPAPFSADVTIRGSGSGVADKLNSKVSIGSMNGTIDASLTEVPGYLGSRFDYRFNWPDAKSFAAYLGIQLAQSGKLAARGSAEIETKGTRLENLNIALDDNKLVLNGLVPSAAYPNDPMELSGSVEGTSFLKLTEYYFPLGFGPPLPFKLAGGVRVSPDNILTTDTDGSVGSTQVETRSRLVLGSPEPDITLSINATGDDFDEWLSQYVREQRINDAFELESTVRLTGTTLSASNLDLRVRGARLQGDVSTVLSGDPENFDNISFDITASGKNLAEELPKLSVYEPAPVNYNLAARGEISESAIALDTVTGRLGSATLDINGSVSLPPAASAQQLTFDIEGDHLNELGSIEGWEVVDVPFDIEGLLQSEGESLTIDKMDFILGTNDLRGKLALTEGEKPFVTVQINSTNFDIATVLTQDQNDAVDAMLDDPDPTKDDGRLIPDAEMPVDWLNSFDAEITVRADRLARGEEELKLVEIQGTLENGALQIPIFRATTTYGDLKSNLSYIPGEEGYEMRAALQANKVRLPGTRDQMTDAVLYQGYDLDFDLTGAGTNIREIFATANGFVWLRGGPKQLENIKYKSLFGDAFTEIGVMINPFYKREPVTNVECEAYFFEIEDGSMETSPIALIKLDRMNITAAGSIDLETEELRLGIENSLRKGVGLSASQVFTPFVRVGGTMTEPRPEFDAKGSLVEGGLAVYTVGLSIVAKSLYNRWIKADRSCEEYAALARQIRIARDPDAPPPD